MGTVGILWEFFSGCKIQQKRIEYAISIVVKFEFLGIEYNYEFVVMEFLNFVLALSLPVVYHTAYRTVTV